MNRFPAGLRDPLGPGPDSGHHRHHTRTTPTATVWLLLAVLSAAILAGIVVALANLTRAERWVVALTVAVVLLVGGYVWARFVGRQR